MGWTDFTRGQYGRRTGRYASDLTEREWSLIAAFMPMPRRLRATAQDGIARGAECTALLSHRRGANGGCCRRIFHPIRPCRVTSTEWRVTGLWQRINHHLVVETRELEGKEASLTAGVGSTVRASKPPKAGDCGY